MLWDGQYLCFFPNIFIFWQHFCTLFFLHVKWVCFFLHVLLLLKSILFKHPHLIKVSHNCWQWQFFANHVAHTARSVYTIVLRVLRVSYPITSVTSCHSVVINWYGRHAKELCEGKSMHIPIGRNLAIHIRSAQFLPGWRCATQRIQVVVKFLV